MCGFIVQLVEHGTSIAEVMGSNPVEALIFFFRLLLSNCLNWKIYCDDHSSLLQMASLLINEGTDFKKNEHQTISRNMNKYNTTSKHQKKVLKS